MRPLWTCQSWLRFPIGTLKTAGALGLLVGVFALPALATVAAFGLTLFFACAVYTHIRVHDYSTQFGLATAFLALSTASLVLGAA